MKRFSTVAVHGLLLVACVSLSPFVFAAIAPSAQAVPSPTGKPGRLEPGGRRALQPAPVPSLQRP